MVDTVPLLQEVKADMAQVRVQAQAQAQVIRAIPTMVGFHLAASHLWDQEDFINDREV